MHRTLHVPHASRGANARRAARVEPIGVHWQLAAILLAGLVLRLGFLSRAGLHPDEALYASWALRIADGRDPALLGVLVDKPPLLPYLLAGLFRLAGPYGASTVDPVSLVFVGRLAAIGASLLSLALLWGIASRVYGRRAAVWCSVLYALSPLTVRLSPSLLTDPWLVLWMLLGLWAGLQGRPWLAGLACGLAYATKQQAVFLIPLILATYWMGPRPVGASGADRGAPWRSSASIRRLLAGFLLVFTMVLWWDSLRWQSMPSFWERGAIAYGGIGLAQGGDSLERLWQWAELIGDAFGWPLLILSLAGGALAWRAGRRSLVDFDRLLLVFVVAYVTVHLASSMAAWDRYALPLAPALSLLLGHGLALLWESCLDVSASGRSRCVARRTNLRRSTAALAAVVLGYTVWLAAFSAIPVGDATAYDGVAQVAKHVRRTQPPDSVLYHHWLGWHYGFYLADAAVELRYWETPQDLADKAGAERDARQLIAFPAGMDRPENLEPLAEAGLSLVPELSVAHPDGSTSITLYRIVSAAAADNAANDPARARGGARNGD